MSTSFVLLQSPPIDLSGLQIWERVLVDKLIGQAEAFPDKPHEFVLHASNLLRSSFDSLASYSQALQGPIGRVFFDYSLRLEERLRVTEKTGSPSESDCDDFRRRVCSFANLLQGPVKETYGTGKELAKRAGVDPGQISRVAHSSVGSFGMSVDKLQATLMKLDLVPGVTRHGVPDVNCLKHHAEFAPSNAGLSIRELQLVKLAAFVSFRAAAAEPISYAQLVTALTEIRRVVGFNLANILGPENYMDLENTVESFTRSALCCHTPLTLSVPDGEDSRSKGELEKLLTWSYGVGGDTLVNKRMSMNFEEGGQLFNIYLDHPPAIAILPELPRPFTADNQIPVYLKESFARSVSLFCQWEEGFVEPSYLQRKAIQQSWAAAVANKDTARLLESLSYRFLLEVSGIAKVFGLLAGNSDGREGHEVSQIMSECRELAKEMTDYVAGMQKIHNELRDDEAGLSLTEKLADFNQLDFDFHVGFCKLVAAHCSSVDLSYLRHHYRMSALGRPCRRHEFRLGRNEIIREHQAICDAYSSALDFCVNSRDRSKTVLSDFARR